MFKNRNSLLLLLILFLFSFLSIGQEIKSVYVDLGKIKKNNEDVVDLVVQNPLDKAIKLIGYETEPPLTFQIMSDYIPAGGYQFFRLKTNMFQLGEFERNLKLHFDRSELDVSIMIKGDMTKLPTNGLQKCPSFDDLPSKREIAKRQKKTNGAIQSRLIPLGPEPDMEESVERALLSDKYKVNNIIFLIDVSSSMGRKGKLELLKSSLETLLSALRDEDRLSVVIYDSEAELLIDNESNYDKDSIRAIIQSLQTKGSTNAIEGIDLAIEKGMKSYLSKGNNQLYLVSDGAFELKTGPDGSMQQIEGAAEQGLRVSVLAIQSNKQSRRSLRKLSKRGNGELIRIDNEKDQRKILKNIMKNSKL